MSKEKRRVPKLRFPGFTEDWEQRKANYIFNSVTDKGYPELPVLSASQELGMVYRDQNGIDIQHDKKNETSYKRVLPGQFVIHLRSFQGGFAYSEVEGITSPAYTVMSFKNSSEQYGLFWKHVFKSETFIKRLETITYGIRDGRSISFSDFKSLILQYPSFSEQKLIGGSIEIIESGITLHQRKLDNLKLKKKALLQKLFPKNGERYPELRFPGFTDAWEQRKFLDLLDAQYGIRRGPFGSSLKKDSFVKKSDYVVYEQQNAIYDNYETRYFISKEKYNELIRFNIQPGDFIMSGAGTIGRISMVPDGIKKGVFNQALIRFKVNKDSINPLYFLKFMQSDMMQKQLTQANPGSAMTNLVPMDELKKWDVTIPSLEEQNKISTFINQIDEFITLHQRKLEHLKLQKKALLQQMFV